MERSCHRCGAQIEEQTTFCAACGAPQIRVATPPAPANEPSTPPLPPGTPESIQPPSIPVSFAMPNRIRWKDYGRIALPISVFAGLAVALFFPAGIFIFFGGIIYCINRYRRGQPNPLTTSQGARLGAFNGLISFITIAVLQAAFNPGGYRQQVMVEVQRRYMNNPDPRMQQLLHWMATDQGFLLVMLFVIIFTLAVFLIVSSFAGALSVTLSRSRERL